MSEKHAEQRSPRQIMATTHACQILRVLHEQNGARITAITEEVGLSKGAVHTQLSTLIANEFVIQAGYEYYPSLLFLEIAEDYKTNSTLYKASNPELKHLAEQENARVQLVVEEFGMAVAFHVERGSHPAASKIQVGKRDYMHTNAAGKAMLAHMPTEHVDEIIERHGLPARTENTITDIDDLYEELDAIRERGVAFNNQENLRGLCAIGAPIRDKEDQIRAGLSLSLPARGLDDESTKEDLAAKILTIANRIELSLDMQTISAD